MDLHVLHTERQGGEGYLRDRSLITERGGYKMGGVASEVLPLQKGEQKKVFAMLKGVGGLGHSTFWCSLSAKVLAILQGGVEGGTNLYPVLRRVGW